MLTNDEKMDRGARAEQAIPYLSELLATAKNEIVDRIIELAPNDAEKFCILKSHILFMDEVLNMAVGDINEGKKAILEIQGAGTAQNGIL